MSTKTTKAKTLPRSTVATINARIHILLAKDRKANGTIAPR